MHAQTLSNLKIIKIIRTCACKSQFSIKILKVRIHVLLTNI